MVGCKLAEFLLAEREKKRVWSGCLVAMHTLAASATARMTYAAAALIAGHPSGHLAGTQAIILSMLLWRGSAEACDAGNTCAA